MMRLLLLITLFFTSLFSQTNLNKIKAGMPANFLPYFYLDKENKPTGFAVEVFKQVAKKADLEYEIIVFPTYVDVEKAYLKKEIDLIIAGGISEKRKEIGNFTEVLDVSNIYAYKLKTNPLKELKFVDDKKITLKSNNVSVKLFKNYPKDLIRFVNSKEEGLVTLLSKESEAFVFNEVAMNSMLSKTGFIDVVEAFGKPVKSVDFAIRIQKDQTKLLNRLNKALIDFKSSDYFTKLYDKYVLGKDIKIKNKSIFTEEEKEYINNKTIKVSFPRVFEPLLMKDINNHDIGIIKDFYDLFSKKYGLKFEFSSYSWQETFDRLKNNQIDIIPIISNKAATKNNFTKIETFVNSSFLIYAKNDFTKNINSINDLTGLRVGFNRNIIVLKNFLEKYKEKFELVPFDDTLDLYYNLHSANIDVSIGFSRDRYFIHKNEFNNIDYIQTLHELKVKSVAAVNSNDELLKSIFTKIIQNLSYDEKLNIMEKWIGKSKNDFLNRYELAYLANNEFKVCPRINHYPLSAVKDNHIVGIGGDISHILFDKLNINHEVINVNSNEDLYDNINNNNCDLVITISKNQDRFKNLDTTNSIFSSSFVSIGNINSFFIDDYTDFTGHVFYVKEILHKELINEKYPQIDIRILKNIDEIFEKVEESEFAHFINIGIIAEYFIQKYGPTKFKINGTFNEVNVYGSIGVNKKHDLLLSSLNKGIDSLDKTKVENIIRKFNINKYKKNTDYTYFWIVILILLIIILLVIYKNSVINEEKRKADDANKKLDLATKSAKIGIWSWDIRNNSLEWDETMKDIYEVQDIKNEMYYDVWKNLLHEDDSFEAQEKLTNALNNNQVFDTVFRIKVPSGKIKYIKASGVVNLGSDNKPISMIGTNEDITFEESLKLELKNNIKIIEESKEEALHLKNLAESQKSVLEYERERAIQASEEAKVSEEEAVAAQEEMFITQEQLIQANEAKSEFLANMSHEIRTPLSGIIGVTDIMLDEECTPKQRENLKIIKNSSNTLKNIINDVLDFSKIQSGKFQIIPRKFSLKELISETESLFKPLVEAKNIDFKVKIDEDVHNYLMGDSLRIQQILNNLIGNSVKFTDNGKIQIKVIKLYENENTTKLEFIIKDTGIGIDEKIQSKIFDSFTQGELSNTKSFQGTGLGLAITKSLIDLMNGDINFSSSVGVGTTFFFKLSFEKVDKLDTKKTEFIKTDDLFLGKKALVVEDSQINQLVAKKILSKMGFEVSIANDGEEGVDAVKKHQYDIVYMDIQMPNMDGFEATKLIREFNKDIPIIALSAAVQDIDKRNSIEVGMNDHLKKPIEKDELVKTTLEYLKVSYVKDSNENKVSKEYETNNTILNIDYLKNEYGEEVCSVLIDTFKTQYQNIKEDIKSLDANELAKYIHKLKGSSGSLKIDEIHELCVNIEKDITNKDLLKSLFVKMDKLLIEIDNNLN